MRGPARHWNVAAVLLTLVLGEQALCGAEPTFNILKPSTTGVPGEEVRVMTFDPEGNLWIAARYPFWFDIGLAMLPPQEQDFAPLPGGGFETGVWQVWSNEDHPIPSVFIHDIAFTPDGVMWIASDGGLTRFDRHATTPQAMWHTYNAANSPLILDGVRSLDVDAQGRIWLINAQVNLVNGALFHFDPQTGTWEQFTVGQELPWEAPWLSLGSVFVGIDGHVYVTHDVLAGFAEYDGTTWIFHGGGAQFGGGLQDLDGNIWFATGNAGLWKWNGSSFQSFGQLGQTSTITGLGLGLDGTVYVSTWYGPIYKMINGATPQFFVDAQGLPRSVMERPDGSIWINNYGSTLAMGRVRQYTNDGVLLRRMNTFNSGLPDYFVENIQTDNSGNVWFATGEGGLSRMEGSDGSQPTRWRNWGDHNDNSEPNPWAGNEPMYSMYEDDQGFIWMGGNGIGKWNPQTGQFLEFWNWENSSLGVDSFIRIIQDGNGEFWAFSDYTAAYHLNPITNDWEHQLFGAGQTINYVEDVTRDTDGNLWVATEVSLFFYNGQDWFAIGSIHGSPVQWPTAIKADPSGGVWIGADNGITHYQDGEWTVYDMSNSPLPANHVNALAVREDGLLAASVSEFGAVTPFPNGVALFDGKTWQVFSHGTHPLPHYQLGDVEFDADGDVWVSTISEGVVEIDLPDPAPANPADLDGNGLVNGIDLGMLLAQWGACRGPLCSADLDENGLVDGIDLGMLLAAWD